MLCDLEALPTASKTVCCRNCGATAMPREKRQCDASMTIDEVHAAIKIGVHELSLSAWQRQRVADKIAKDHGLSREEFDNLFPLMNDPTLIGNRIKVLFSRFGVPPCAGCDNRAEWFNRGHDFLRSLFGIV